MQNFLHFRPHWTCIAAGALAALCACRKEKNELPTVEIVQPAPWHVLAVPDTLLVHVRVSDDRGVESVWFGVTDVNGVPIAPVEVRSVHMTSGDVHAALPITAASTPGGQFKLTVRASDGTDTRSAFRDITIQPEPLRLRAVFLFPPPGTAPATITRVDSADHISTWTTMSDISGGAVSSILQYVAFAGGPLAPLMAFSTNGPGAWQVANLNAMGAPYFNGLRADPADGRFYVSTADGFIRGYTPQGQQLFTAPVPEHFQSYRTAVVGNLLVSAQDHIAQPVDRIANIAMPGGNTLGGHPLDLHVLHMDARGADHVMVFGERDGEGVIQERHVISGGVYEMRTFAEGPIRAVQAMGAGVWIVALPGRIVRFTYSNNGLSVVADGITADALAYEQATGTLYVGLPGQLLRMDPFSGATLSTLPIPVAIGGILPLLNR